MFIKTDEGFSLARENEDNYVRSIRNRILYGECSDERGKTEIKKERKRKPTYDIHFLLSVESNYTSHKN